MLNFPVNFQYFYLLKTYILTSDLFIYIFIYVVCVYIYVYMDIYTIQATWFLLQKYLMLFYGADD